MAPPGLTPKPSSRATGHGAVLAAGARTRGGGRGGGRGPGPGKLGRAPTARASIALALLPRCRACRHRRTARAPAHTAAAHASPRRRRTHLDARPLLRPAVERDEGGVRAAAVVAAARADVLRLHAHAHLHAAAERAVHARCDDQHHAQAAGPAPAAARTPARRSMAPGLTRPRGRRVCGSAGPCGCGASSVRSHSTEGLPRRRSSAGAPGSARAVAQTRMTGATAPAPAGGGRRPSAPRGAVRLAAAGRARPAEQHGWRPQAERAPRSSTAGSPAWRGQGGGPLLHRVARSLCWLVALWRALCRCRWPCGRAYANSVGGCGRPQSGDGGTTRALMEGPPAR